MTRQIVNYVYVLLYNVTMTKTRKANKKVRITIRAYEKTIENIKESGSSLQKEWDKYIEKKWGENTNCDK